MFRTHRVAAAVLVGRQVIAESSAGACDPATDTCAVDAGDDMSAMQLKWGPSPPEPAPAPTPPTSDVGCSDTDKKNGCGRYWELLDVNTLGKTMNGSYSMEGYAYSYNTVKSDPVPWCLQGLVYLDQACTTYPDLPKNERPGPCLNAAPGHFWVNEFVTSFGNWDAKSRCFTAERRGWVFGQGDSANSICRAEGIRACMPRKGKKGYKKDPCAIGAQYDAVDFAWPATWYFIKTKSGWTRKTPVWWPKYSYYPVPTIVDGKGKKTKWYKYMVDEAMRLDCPPGSEADARVDQRPPCRRSLWADQNKIARCTRPAD